MENRGKHVIESENKFNNNGDVTNSGNTTIDNSRKVSKNRILLPILLFGGISIAIGGGVTFVLSSGQTEIDNSGHTEIKQPAPEVQTIPDSKADQSSSEPSSNPEIISSSTDFPVSAYWAIGRQGFETRKVLGEFSAANKEQAMECFEAHEAERESKKIPNSCTETAGISNYPFNDLKGEIHSAACTLKWFSSTQNVDVQVYRIVGEEDVKMTPYAISPPMCGA